MGIIRYCSDEELINNLRMYFPEDQQYSIPFSTWLHTMKETNDGLLLTVEDRQFPIHPVTGTVLKEVK